MFFSLVEWLFNKALCSTLFGFLKNDDVIGVCSPSRFRGLNGGDVLLELGWLFLLLVLEDEVGESVEFLDMIDSMSEFSFDLATKIDHRRLKLIIG